MIVDGSGRTTSITYDDKGATDGYKVMLEYTSTYPNLLTKVEYSDSAYTGYAYDAWGKVLAVTDKDGNAITDADHMANINPIRYRGYYYDTETGWYYLNARYYDPNVRRFINSDNIAGEIGAIGFNVFSYCHNDPVNRIDTNGNFDWRDELLYCPSRQPGGGYVPSKPAAPIDDSAKTPPDIVNPYTSTGAGQDKNYYQKETYTNKTAVDADAAQELANSIAIQNRINAIKDDAALAIVSFGATSGLSIGKAAIAGGAEFILTSVYDSIKSGNATNIANGDYTKVVVLYESQDGDQLILTKTYSDMENAYLNTGWVFEGYDAGKSLEDYSQIEAFIRR